MRPTLAFTLLLLTSRSRKSAILEDDPGKVIYHPVANSRVLTYTLPLEYNPKTRVGTEVTFSTIESENAVIRGGVDGEVYLHPNQFAAAVLLNTKPNRWAVFVRDK